MTKEAHTVNYVNRGTKRTALIRCQEKLKRFEGKINCYRCSIHAVSLSK